ncbi:MAG: hypothetical protein ACI35W_07890 [Anaeroplasmataceae bacterium]
MKNRNLKGSVKLIELIYYKRLRTVEDDTAPGSPKEYLINIDLKDPFRDKLSFRTPYHGHLYAYAFITEPMKKLLDTYGFTLKGVMVDLVDWDDKFVLSLEEDKREVQFFCSIEDVIFLLENCMRIPSQRLINKNKKGV